MVSLQVSPTHPKPKSIDFTKETDLGQKNLEKLVGFDFKICPTPPKLKSIAFALEKTYVKKTFREIQ